MEKQNPKRKRLCLLLCTAILFSGCQPDKKKKGDEAEKVTYRDSFTEEEKAHGTAKFDLMEGVTVDADITPSEKYKNGLKKYYMKHFLEPGTIKSRKDFKDKPTLFGRKLSKSMDMIAEKVDGTFSGKQTEWNAAEMRIQTTFAGNNGKSYDFMASWVVGDNVSGAHDKAASPIVYMELPDGENRGMDTNMAEKIKQYLRDYNDMEVSFIKDKKKAGEELKEFLEKLVGRKISDTWDCVPVTAESVAALNKV